MLGLGLKIPLSFFSKPTRFWNTQAALWGSCYFISPLLLPSRRILLCWKLQKMSPQLYGLQGLCHYYRVVCLRKGLSCTGAPPRTALSVFLFTIVCTPQTCSTTHSPVICRNTHVTLQLRSASLIKKKSLEQRTEQPLCGMVEEQSRNL